LTRVVVAKAGLDGHDRGAKIVARVLRDAGMEVIYLGLRNRPEHIAQVAIEEDARVIGLSMLSGSHLPLTKKLMDYLVANDALDIGVVVGGTIPRDDIPRLMAMGVAAVTPTSTPLDVVVEVVRRVASKEGEGYAAG
jgi:methylmalonyl-CoA mutase, C-terminal domain